MLTDEMKALWCNWTHGGGHITRDEQGRINWRCRKCGRWGNSTVSHENARRAVDLSVRNHLENSRG